MLQFMPPNVMPCTATKIEYSKSIITLFSRLRDIHTAKGFETFFDPASKKEFLTTRLRNLFRDKPKIRDDKYESNNELEKAEDLVEDKIEFLKFATKDQTDEIFAVTKETFQFRNHNRQEIGKRFPRFVDTDGLILFEFSLMYPGKETIFAETFPRYISVIKEVYGSTVTLPDQRLLKASDDNDEWNTSTNALLILIHLLPQTATKKSNEKVHQVLFKNSLCFEMYRCPSDQF